MSYAPLKTKAERSNNTLLNTLAYGTLDLGQDKSPIGYLFLSVASHTPNTTNFGHPFTRLQKNHHLGLDVTIITIIIIMTITRRSDTHRHL